MGRPWLFWPTTEEAEPEPGALPAFADAGAGYESATLAATHSTIPCPATVGAGDLLILQCELRNTAQDGAISSGPAGWIAFPGNPYGGANNSRQAFFWKIAAGTEGGTNISVTATGGGASDGFYARVYRFTAADGFAAAPIEAIASNAGSSTSVGFATVTPTDVNRLACQMVALSAGEGGIESATGESGGDWTEAVAEFDGSVGADGVIQLQTSDQSGGGAISGGTISLSSSRQWTTVGFALVPADV